ncbi:MULTISPECIES: hypothetical protein [Peptostreptococcus]|jgi:hypothetical protein|uniref:Phage tail protein n=1 Tax=Peptostreptococcus anaerobius TaxID=1261 RepID=A0A135YZ52_9FIRM|nr:MULTISPECIES: hypothetical protein [Peptostreptococcus]KXI14673.1 hypothetical protein HMPREF3195_00128 [Peptostreptococcus anaerobius]MBS5596600.1 hypothetical protein [Peptostreptococcus sp.]MDU1264585.1 hypothetical protein [Peptostreptococcus sp.]
MANRDTQFSYFRVTNGHMLFDGEEQAKKLGCTGEIEVESEIKTITKKCEGVDKEKRSQVVGQKIKFVGHIEREVLNDIFGINTNGLKKGVYAYGKNSLGKVGTLTWDAYDMMETDVELLAFPKVSVASGLTLGIKNGEDEVAEIEVEFSVTEDDYGQFMYRAFKSEATEVAEKWHTKFESKNMQKGL